MKQLYKISILMAAIFALATGCKDWTRQEAIEFKYTTLAEKNPALYQAYLQSLREYHKTDHPVMICRFDNVSGAPVNCAQRLECVPDSTDYVILANVENVSARNIEEMAAIRADKGIKTLGRVDYNAIIAAFDAAREEDPTIPDTRDSRVEYVTEQVQAFLRNVRKLDLDGVVFAFVGSSTIPMSASAKADYIALQNAFFEPGMQYAETHRTKDFIFEGTPKYITDDEFGVLDASKYIILPMESATGVTTFSYEVQMQLTDDVPVDRFVIGVCAIDDANDLSTEGYLSDGSSAIVGAAQWVASPVTRYQKKGVCVNHAQRDYYGIGVNYGDICRAISIMNPSPKN